MKTEYHDTLNKQDVRISTANGIINGILTFPKEAKALVLFAHGAGSSRLSPRNQHVAGVLNQDGLATLLMDLLTPHEEQLDMVTGQLRFDIDFLARRLDEVTQWVLKNDNTRRLTLGCFGSSTGAAAALKTAVQNPQLVKALVSRGGRPDMAEDVLALVKAPTLLIVGSLDTVVLDLNRQAFDMLQVEKELVVVPGATHLFEESGKLDEVAAHAKRWFMAHLTDG